MGGVFTEIAEVGGGLMLVDISLSTMYASTPMTYKGYSMIVVMQCN